MPENFSLRELYDHCLAMRTTPLHPPTEGPGNASTTLATKNGAGGASGYNIYNNSWKDSQKIVLVLPGRRSAIAIKDN